MENRFELHFVIKAEDSVVCCDSIQRNFAALNKKTSAVIRLKQHYCGHRMHEG